MSYPYIVQGNNIVVVIGNTSHTVSKTHITYQKVLDAIKAQDWDLVKDVIEPKKVVLNYGRGNVTIQGEQLFWRGEVFHSSLASRMIQMLQDGFSIEPMVAFMENLMQNPSKRSVTELYGFLEKNELPITPDGHFLAYKKVRGNFMDCHSGSMDNSVGKIVEMERNAVDDDKDRTCSTGLHFCGQSYLQHFGGERTVIVKINPKDVVSIPSDYNDAKGRTCRYEVIGELNVSPGDAFPKSVQETAVGSQRVSKAMTGSTPFYRGYTAGYTDSIQTSGYPISSKDNENFNQGYDKGQNDAADGFDAVYQYVAAPDNVMKQQSAWPQPKWPRTM